MIIIYIAIFVCKITLSKCDRSLEAKNGSQTHHLFLRETLGGRMINCSLYPTFNNISVFKLDYCMNQKRQSKNFKDFIRVCKSSDKQRRKILSTRPTKGMKDVCSPNGNLRNEYLEHLSCLNGVNTDCTIQIQHDIKIIREKRSTSWRQDMKTNYAILETPEQVMLNQNQLCKSVHSCLMFVQTMISATCGQQTEELTRQIFNMTVLSQLKGKCDDYLVNYSDSSSLALSISGHDWVEILILRLIILTLLCYLLGPTIVHWLQKLTEQMCMSRIDSRSDDSMEVRLEESYI